MSRIRQNILKLEPLFVRVDGYPGIGKSEIVGQIASEAGYYFIDTGLAKLSQYQKKSQAAKALVTFLNS